MSDPQLKYETREAQTRYVDRLLIQQLGQPGVLIARRSSDSKYEAGGWHAVGGKREDLSPLENLYNEVEQELGIAPRDIVILGHASNQNRRGNYVTQFHKAFIFPDAKIRLNSENAGFDFVQTPWDLLRRKVVFKNRAPLLRFMLERSAALQMLGEEVSWQSAIAVSLFMDGMDYENSRYVLQMQNLSLPMKIAEYLKYQKQQPESGNYAPNRDKQNSDSPQLIELYWFNFAEAVFHFIHAGCGQLENYTYERMLIQRTFQHLTITDLLRWLEAIARCYPNYLSINQAES